MSNSIPSRLWAVRTAAALLILFTAAASDLLQAQTASAAPDAKIPADHSLTSNDYIKLGVPAADRTWGGPDMARAAKALTALAEKHPEQLPRYNSKRSGDLFNRITSAQNLEICRDKSLAVGLRFQDALQILGASGNLLNVYLKSFLDKKTADSEVLEIMGSVLRASVAVMDVTDEFTRTLDKTDPTYKTRMDGLQKMKKGLANVVAGSIQTLTERPGYRKSELIRFIGYMRETLPALVPRLLPGSRKETIVRLETLDKDDSMKDLQPGLHNLVVKVKAALDKDAAP